MTIVLVVAAVAAVWLVVVVFTLALCRAAALGDRRIEQYESPPARAGVSDLPSEAPAAAGTLTVPYTSHERRWRA